MVHRWAHSAIACLGNATYGIYLFQHYGYINRIGHPNFPLFIFYLTYTGIVGYAFIQHPCKSFFTRHGLRALRLWRSSRAASELSRCLSRLESELGRKLTVVAFFLVATIYVRTNPHTIWFLSFPFRFPIVSPFDITEKTHTGQLATVPTHAAFLHALLHGDVSLVPSIRFKCCPQYLCYSLSSTTPHLCRL